MTGPVWYNPSEHDSIVRDLESAGWNTFEFDGGTDVRTLFQEFKVKLPLDPPISGRVNWDAFADSLWSGLDDLHAPRVALLWRGAGNLAHADPRSFEIARDVLLTTAEQLRAGTDGARPGRDIRVLFELTPERSAAEPS